MVGCQITDGASLNRLRLRLSTLREAAIVKSYNWGRPLAREVRPWSKRSPVLRSETGLLNCGSSLHSLRFELVNCLGC